RSAPAVPIKGLVVADVPQGGAAPRKGLVACADSLRQAVGQTFLANMTRIAGTRLIEAQSLVKEKLSAQRDLFLGHRIVSPDLHWLVVGQSFRERQNFRLEGACRGSR